MVDYRSEDTARSLTIWVTFTLAYNFNTFSI